MPKFSSRIRSHIDTTGKTNIKIRVSHQGKTRYIATPHHIPPGDFDNEAGRVRDYHPLAADINIELQVLELSYARKMLKLGGAAKAMSMQDLLRYLADTDTAGELDFHQVIQRRIDALRGSGRIGGAKILQQTKKRVEEFDRRSTLPFNEISATWLRRFESWYCKTGSQNSAAIHLRNIRSSWNIAIDDYSISPEGYPFRKFKVKTRQTIHRDLSAKEVALLASCTLKGFQDLARDLWLLSFYLVGMNFVDLLLAKRSDIKKGRLEYYRAKTGTLYSIYVEPEAQDIINKYRGQKMLLNIMERKNSTKEDRSTPIYKDITDQSNKALKSIARGLNKGRKDLVIDEQLSTYYARHSWGSIASKEGVSHDVIREALGHSRSVTDTYINFYLQRIDDANRRVLDSIKTYQQGG